MRTSNSTEMIGTLKIIKEDRATCEGLIRCIKEYEKNKWNEEADLTKYKIGDIKIGVNYSKGVFEYWEPVQPIIICNNEIKAGDKYYTKDRGIKEFTEEDDKERLFNPIYLSKAKKVLVLPNQFSPETIQLIVNGRLKDGDKVEVETDMKYKKGDIGLDFDITLKLNNNFATIHPYKESVEEAADKYASTQAFPDQDRYFEFAYNGFIAGAKWQAEQNPKNQ